MTPGYPQPRPSHQRGVGPVPPPSYGPPRSYSPPSAAPRAAGAPATYGPRAPSTASRRPPPRPAGTAHKRTDPTLYEWHRLPREKQEAVLATVGRARLGAARRAWRRALLAVVIVILLAALAYLALALVAPSLL